MSTRGVEVVCEGVVPIASAVFEQSRNGSNCSFVSVSTLEFTKRVFPDVDAVFPSNVMSLKLNEGVAVT